MKAVLAIPISRVREWKCPDASATSSEPVRHSGNLDLYCSFLISHLN